jgi:hypothetical protein
LADKVTELRIAPEGGKSKGRAKEMLAISGADGEPFLEHVNPS